MVRSKISIIQLHSMLLKHCFNGEIMIHNSSENCLDNLLSVEIDDGDFVILEKNAVPENFTGNKVHCWYQNQNNFAQELNSKFGINWEENITHRRICIVIEIIGSKFSLKLL